MSGVDRKKELTSGGYILRRRNMKRVKRRRERNEKKRIRMVKERWKFEQFCFSERNIED